MATTAGFTGMWRFLKAADTLTAQFAAVVAQFAALTAENEELRAQLQQYEEEAEELVGLAEDLGRYVTPMGALFARKG